MYMLTEIRLTHIRQHDHYDKDPTAKDEVLTLSRWLMLEVYEDFSSNCINTPYTCGRQTIFETRRRRRTTILHEERSSTDS